MYAYICVCIYIYIYTCICVCIYIYLRGTIGRLMERFKTTQGQKYMCVCIYVLIDICVYVYLTIGLYRSLDRDNKDNLKNTDIHVYIYVYVYTYICVYVYIYVCVCVCVCVCTCVCTSGRYSQTSAVVSSFTVQHTQERCHIHNLCRVLAVVLVYRIKCARTKNNMDEDENAKE